MAKARGFSNFSLVSPLERSILTLAEGLAGEFPEKSDHASDLDPFLEQSTY
jgi:hypothetical protein